MRRFLKRTAEILIFLLLFSFVSFVLVKMAPGDPVKSILRVDDVSATTDQVEELRQELGFDQPIYVQYWRWLCQFFRMDFGESYLTNEPVIQLLLSKLPATIELMAGSLAVMLMIAVPLGSLAAVYRSSWIDKVSRFAALAGSSVPSFWLGLLLIDLFAVRMNWFPTMGREGLSSLVLPALTLGIAMSAMYIRLIRSSLLESLGQDFIRAARARGLSEIRIFFMHAFRHCLTPVITVFGVSIGSLIGGIVVIEVLFSYPGIGKLVVDSISRRDYPVIQGYVLFMAAGVLLINTCVDLSYRFLDPSIRLKGVKQK
ncbi:nickel ABC transporter permease [Bacillus sp. SW14]|uniref:nickel ABC transporter permease n=1 Tax=Bacillus sp. SW14 TaxID=3391618 RepID=UPI0039E333F3